MNNGPRRVTSAVVFPLAMYGSIFTLQNAKKFNIKNCKKAFLPSFLGPARWYISSRTTQKSPKKFISYFQEISWFLLFSCKTAPPLEKFLDLLLSIYTKSDKKLNQLEFRYSLKNKTSIFLLEMTGPDLSVILNDVTASLDRLDYNLCYWVVQWSWFSPYPSQSRWTCSHFDLLNNSIVFV